MGARIRIGGVVIPWPEDRLEIVVEADGPGEQVVSPVYFLTRGTVRIMHGPEPGDAAVTFRAGDHSDLILTGHGHVVRDVLPDGMDLGVVANYPLPLPDWDGKGD